MSFRNKLNRLKPHLSSKGGGNHVLVNAPKEQGEAIKEIPYQEKWEEELVKPFFYDGQYCLIREKEFSIHEQYGNYTFSQFIDAVTAWNETTFGHPLSSKGFEPSQLFFFDTETTGLGGGTGNTIFLLGYASIKNDKIVLRQHFLPQPGAEIALYQSFLESIDYTTLVTYNGKAFDWPQVKTRHTLIREHVPKLPSFGHFDLFHAARRLWKHKLDRLKLSIVEKEVLGIERKDDVPGFLAPMIYFDFVENQNPNGILGILKHNEMDILSLITLYTHLTFQLLNIDKNRTSAEGFEVGRWYAALGETSAATQNLSMIAHGENHDALKAKHILAFERKKQKDWEQACALWEELTACLNHEFSYNACIELAKYYEHMAKKIDTALYYTEKARNMLDEGLIGYRDEINKRFVRLKKKQTRHSTE